MKKEWGLLPKILGGEKTIESRWLKVKVAPWGRVQVGDRVYFKNSSEPVTVGATVARVIQTFLTSEVSADSTSEVDSLGSTVATVKEILEKYGERDGLGIDDVPYFCELFKDKSYCILIFLKHPQRVKPFEIDKSGFGMQSAWLCVETIDKVRK